MHKLLSSLLLALLLASQPARAADEPGVFDYWVLSLSWSPQYCNDHERDLQCLRRYNFVLQGLWPQYEVKGYPEDCRDVEYMDKELVSRMTTLMASPPLIQREWREHGSCSGMNVDDYFLTMERVHRSLLIPAGYLDVPRELRTTVAEIKDAFIQSNNQLSPEQIALKCSGRYLQEVRICYDKDFQPRDCGEGVRDHCGKRVVMRPTL